jgi:hypothetical protein
MQPPRIMVLYKLLCLLWANVVCNSKLPYHCEFDLDGLLPLVGDVKQSQFLTKPVDKYPRPLYTAQSTLITKKIVSRATGLRACGLIPTPHPHTVERRDPGIPKKLYLQGKSPNPISLDPVPVPLYRLQWDSEND